MPLPQCCTWATLCATGQCLQLPPNEALSPCEARRGTVVGSGVAPTQGEAWCRCRAPPLPDERCRVRRAAAAWRGVAPPPLVEAGVATAGSGVPAAAAAPSHGGTPNPVAAARRCEPAACLARMRLRRCHASPVGSAATSLLAALAGLLRVAFPNLTRIFHCRWIIWTSFT